MTSRRAWMARSASVPGVAYVLPLLVLVFAVLAPGFISPPNLINISIQSAILLLLALPMTFIIISEGLDLSPGALIGLSSVVLALLQHAGADGFLNAALSPVTTALLGLPVVLGVPLLFGVLRKELSLLLIFQALGTLEIGSRLDSAQMMTLLVFLTLYVPCVATFAAMTRTIGQRQALYSVGISVAAALGVSVAVRLAMTAAGALAGWVA